MSKKVILIAVGLALLLHLPLAADWDPADGHKMHFPQLPNETGWAVNATQPLVLADDWQCSETGFVRDVHFWGAWKGGIEGQMVQLFLSIHSDIPAEQSPTGFSMPGATLWEADVLQFTTVRPVDTPALEGWYDPATGEVIAQDHQAYYQYNVLLPEDLWFVQEEGTIYWLNISAIVVDPQGTVWGWKSSLDHWNDDAVWAMWGTLNWQEMYEPSVPIINDFGITILPGGVFANGGGSGAYGQGWYYYPDTDWWNIWFYDHPYREDRFKVIHIEYDVFMAEPGLPSFLELAVNWSTAIWSLLGNPEPDPRVPPLPGVDESAYIGRQTLYLGPVEPGHYIFDWTIPDYNPEWVSIDVRGENFDIPFGMISHECIGQQSLDLSFVITGGPFEPDTCDFYKLPYLDYAPQGMPDFDQKQINWVDNNQHWSHDGPAALANCIWWFDSKFETAPVDPRPFGSGVVNDNYPLVGAYGPWDDHDTANVQPFINDLAMNYLNTNPGGLGGTHPGDLQTGFRAYLAAHGMQPDYSDTFYVDPSFDLIRDQVLQSQDVILYLSFYEDLGSHWNYIGSHYVTVAGVCTQNELRQLCVSDPFLDALEGEPPAGAAHGGTVHNDANNISGPHNQIQHDPYLCAPVVPPGAMVPVEEVNYPAPALLGHFQGMNAGADWFPYGGGILRTVIDLAYVICPAGCDCIPGDADGSGSISIGDAVYIINYIFGGGPAPMPYAICSGDANCDCTVSISDAVYIVNFIFGGGPQPCDCPTWLSICGAPLRN